jgi:regulator of protease activity HflC (stomatin/prohibitin superfamily)
LVDTGGPPPLPAADVSLEEAERIRERSIKVKKVPLINTQGHVTLKESILNPGMRDMICSDNSVIFVNPIVFFQITDPELAAYEVNSLGESLLAITETVLRQEVGRLDGDSVISSREVLGAKLQEHLRIATEPWGARIVRVEIQDITFGNDVQEKLTKAREAELEGRGDVATAERDRDAVIARAEGQKRAKELAAEAEFRAAQLTAEGDYLLESRKREGEAAGNKAVAESLMNTPDAMVMIQAFKSQEEVAMHLGQSEGLIVLPEESAGLIGALAATVKSYSSTKLTDKQ